MITGWTVSFEDILRKTRKVKPGMILFSELLQTTKHIDLIDNWGGIKLISLNANL